MYPDLDLRGKDVVEIGCGLGGRTAHIATLQPKSVLGVDINREEIEEARRLSRELHPELSGVLDFRCVGEDESLGTEFCDVVILIDAIEHVVSPVSIVRHAYSYLRPGGVLYFSSFGWFSARGSHTGLFPFVNVFFSDESILRAIRWKVSQPWYRTTRFDSDPPVRRWEWLYDLSDRPGEHLNKITIAEVRRLLRNSKFSRTSLWLRGFGRGFVRRVTDMLVKVPVIREVAHGYFVAVCQK
jgi:SAM-dependent methyltransferase